MTLFPEMFETVIGSSIIKRAGEKGLVEINLLDIRSFSEDKHSSVDDYSYGGGAGQILSPQPIFSAMNYLTTSTDSPKLNHKNIYMSPRGKVLDTELSEELSKLEEITILCGHYEGVDQRAIDYFRFEEISIGDYVLTGGELPAMVLLDSAIRLIPGVLGNSDSARDESIASGLLEYPQYTRPASFLGLDVPSVLLGGNHKEIARWRQEQAEQLTKKNRPEIYGKYKEKETKNDDK